MSTNQTYRELRSGDRRQQAALYTRLLDRWGMADVSSVPGSKLVLEGPLTDEWTDHTYRAATYPRQGGDVIDEAYGEWPEDALVNLLRVRNGTAR